MTIYKFELPAFLSIGHRATGMILSGYAATFAAVSLFSSKPMLEIVQSISHCYPNFFLCFKIGLIFPFTYHFFNGIRHLVSCYLLVSQLGLNFKHQLCKFTINLQVWDGGKNLSMKGVYISGYTMLLAAGASGIALYLF